MQDINSEDTSRVKKSIFSFIWNKEPDKIKRSVMCQDSVNEGLRAPCPNDSFQIFEFGLDLESSCNWRNYDRIVEVYPILFFPNIRCVEFPSSLQLWF